MTQSDNFFPPPYHAATQNTRTPFLGSSLAGNVSAHSEFRHALRGSLDELATPFPNHFRSPGSEPCSQSYAACKVRALTHARGILGYSAWAQYLPATPESQSALTDSLKELATPFPDHFRSSRSELPSQSYAELKLGPGWTPNRTRSLIGGERRCIPGVIGRLIGRITMSGRYARYYWAGAGGLSPGT